MNKFSILSAVLSILIIKSSCSISYPKHKYDKSSLYYNGKIISKDTRLVISLENKSGFSIDGQNTSKDTLILKEENNKIIVLPGKMFTLKIDSGSRAELVNQTKNNIKVDFRIYNHKSKIVETIYDTKN